MVGEIRLDNLKCFKHVSVKLKEEFAHHIILPFVSTTIKRGYNMKGITFFLLLASLQFSFAHISINTSPIPPVELTSFTAQVENSVVHLSWTTASELNNEGFEIERAIQIGQWQEIGFMEGMGTTNEPQTYEFKDSLINVVAERIYYRIKQIDFDGTFQYSDEIEISLHQITLRDTTNQYDYIIITVPEFVNACEPFRQHKETVRDFRTLIVDTTQIFAEFDSSATPQDNIRDFISYAGTFWEEPRPKFFLIAGTVNMVPNFPISFPSQPSIYFHSDYYYCQNIYENDSTTTDFYIGRIPSKDDTEINNYFSKVISYEIDDSIHSWMNNALFLCAGDGNQNIEDAFGVAAIFPTYIRPFYIAENDTSPYYGTLDSIYIAINQRGNLVVWLFGLGDDPYIGGSDWITPGDLNGFTNDGKYFFTFASGRQSAIIDTNINLSKAMLALPHAGSLGGCVFVGYTYFSINQSFQINWASRIFNPTFNSLGEVFVSDSLPFSGLYNYVRKVANLWADPSLHLKYDKTVGVEKFAEELPKSFTLYQNYPNPFNPSTTIKFALPVAENVKINVYNSLGQLVETLVDGEMQSGNHEVKFDASRLASGIYLYQLQVGEYNTVKKMILLK